MSDKPAASADMAPAASAGIAARVADADLCPWCSADLAGCRLDRCPSCGACLAGDPNVSVPGLTTVDPDLVRRATARPAAPKRRLFGFLDDGHAQQEESAVQPSSVEALAPPSAEVRLEMLRLRAELDAAAASERERVAV